MALFDLFSGLKSDFSSKVKNPFIGTYFAVFIIRRWELFYSIFTFDGVVPLEDRVAKIQELLSERCLRADVLYSILITFGILISSYALANLSRIIVTFSEDNIKPLIQKNFGNDRVVDRNRFQTLRDALNRYRVSNDEYQEKILALEEDVKSLNSRIELAQGKLASSIRDKKRLEEDAIEYSEKLKKRDDELSAENQKKEAALKNLKVEIKKSKDLQKELENAQERIKTLQNQAYEFDYIESPDGAFRRLSELEKRELDDIISFGRLISHPFPRIIRYAYFQRLIDLSDAGEGEKFHVYYTDRGKIGRGNSL
ncbi:hypothetical protein [Sanyastnella coralliicola]|uniref:hypothetical protein n=1 Tax=Sanyastnella coralliicola TaxID=3069118 RepID=UPI0027B96D6D|nr:hypothetical protein [Longitalea sp. SCSIO 12813]